MAYAFLSFQGKGGDDALLRSIIDRSVTEIDIPDGVTKVGSTAFANCTKLVRISIPDSVTSIGSSVFQNVPITELIVPLGCKAVNGFSFANMPKLESIKLGDVNRVQTQAFAHDTLCLSYDFTRCTAVPQLDNVDAFMKINAEARILVPAHLYDEWVAATNWATYADHIVAVGKEYKPSEGLEYNYNEYTKSYGVVGLGDCTDTVLVIPEEHEGCPVTSVFMSDMDAVKEIVLPDTIKVIMSTLQNCDALERVSFGSGVTTILYWAFNGNVNCREYDFSRCEQVPLLSFYGTEPDTFIGMPEDCRMIVPAALYEQWITATNWATYRDHIVSAT